MPAPIGLPVEPQQRAVNKRVRRVLACTVNGSACDAAEIMAWDPHAVEVEATLC